MAMSAPLLRSDRRAGVSTTSAVVAVAVIAALAAGGYVALRTPPPEGKDRDSFQYDVAALREVG
jgi:hypothetical protein